MKKIYQLTALLSLFIASITLSVRAESETTQDPWESYNRSMFAFNDVTDRYVLKPIAKGYVYVTPNLFRKGVNNIFSNLGEISTVLNDLLQGKPKQALNDSGRFLINSTIGLVGLFDVASRMGLKPSDGEDFGQTLAVWGVNSGPFVVLPFLGPSTVRDAGALPVDWYSHPEAYIDNQRIENTLLGLYVVNLRANLLDLEKHLTGDRYTFVRDAYLQRRIFLINDGVVEDDFGLDDDFDF